MVTLLRLTADSERWEVRCEATGEEVRVRLQNLRPLPNRPASAATSGGGGSGGEPSKQPQPPRTFGLDIVLQETLKNLACGGELGFEVAEAGLRIGQLSAHVFVLAVEQYIRLSHIIAPVAKSELAIVNDVIDFVGQPGDTQLVLKSLPARLRKATQNPYSRLGPDPLAFRTAQEMVNILYYVRKGTIAHLRSRQDWLATMVDCHLRRSAAGGEPPCIMISPQPPPIGGLMAAF